MIIEGELFFFFIETFVVTPHLNRLVKMVQVRGHNICFMQNY